MSKKHTDAPEGQQPEGSEATAPEKKPHCGIIMPISDTPGYDPGHWLEVRSLIMRAAKEVGYTAGMVSENDGQDVIHRSIVKNIYHNELVVCDVSSLNPNVMLELGLRMANKKPLIVIFDGEGVYPFDIKNMLYIPYPKGLRHSRVENFVQELAGRMLQITEAEKNGKYEPFLNHFNDVVIEESKLEITTQSVAETLSNLMEEIRSIKLDVAQKNTDNHRKYRQESEVVTSAIFTPEEQSFIRNISERMYEFNRELPRKILIDRIAEEITRLVNSTDPLLENKPFANKIQKYSRSFKIFIGAWLIVVAE